MTELVDIVAANPFLVGVKLEEVVGTSQKTMPFGELEAIRAEHPVTWWHYLCCWHSSRYYSGAGWDVRDRWGNPDPEHAGEVFEKPKEADDRAKELNGSDSFCCRQPLPKEAA